MESREQELLFDTKLDGISGFIVEDMGSLKSVRIYLTDPVVTKINKKDMSEKKLIFRHSVLYAVILSRVINLIDIFQEMNNEGKRN